MIREKSIRLSEEDEMSKQVLIISTSLRKNSNSEALADAFARGVEQAGSNVQKIRLRDKAVQFCKGCLACQKTGKCIIKDDMSEIIRQMHDADVIVFATPIYYYEMCGQMKTLLDRSNPLYGTDYHFREIYLLAAAAEEGKHVVSKTQNSLQGWIDCFEKADLKGTVFAGGVTGTGEISGHHALQTAFEMGRKVES